MRKIKDKTNTMQRIEQIYGKNEETIEEILRRMYIDEEKNIEEIAKELNLSTGTVYHWLKLADIKMRKMKWE